MKAFVEKIIVEGFKSYGRERKEIPLGEGFVAIVGPNGAGKSNIGDALSFALGIATTKTLRAKNLSYLIFSTQEERADYAYVEVHFRNEGAFPVEDGTLIVSRKVSADGRSVFRINGKTVREKDLRDFLSRAGIYESGYNVVLQGDVVRFLKMTPAERRKVIEDVAGISEYEAKKQKAINDLVEVDIKIRELKLLLEEIKLQLARLKEEKDRLRRYRELREERRKVEVFIIAKELRKLKEEEKKLSEREKELSSKLDTLKETLKEKEELLTKKERELKDLGEKLLPFKERVGRVSTTIEHVEEELTRRGKEMENALAEREKEERSLRYLEKDLKTLEEELTLLEKELCLREREYEELCALERSAYEELKRLDERLKVSIEEMHRIQEKEKTLKEDIQRKRERINSLRLELKEMDLKIERTSEEIENLRKEKEKTAQEIEKYRRMGATERDMLRREREHLRELEEELKRVRSGLEEVIKEKAFVESRLSDTEATADIFGEIPGVYGTVGDLVKVKDPTYVRAIEVAGGGRLRYVVVEDELVAKECIELLRKKGLGRMSFIPLRRLRHDTRLPPYPRTAGAIDFVINLLEYEDKFERAVRFVFGDTLLVKDFESARRIGIGSYRMVTLEGELFEKSGVITGGAHKTSAILGRKFYLEERERLGEEERRLRERESDTLRKLRALRSEISEKEGILKVIERKLSDLRKPTDFEEKIKKAKEYIRSLKERKERLEREISELTEGVEYEEEKLRNLLLKHRDIVNHYRSFGIEEKRQEYERLKRRTESKRSELEKLRLVLKDRESHISSIKQEIERKRARVEDLDALVRKLEEEIKSLKARKHELEEKVRDIEENVYHLYREKDRVEEEVRELRAELGRLRMEEEDLLTKGGEVSANLSRVRQRVSDLEDKLAELGHSGDLPRTPESVSKLKERLRKIEKELGRLGSVNLRADEDYEEEFARYRDYEEKYARLQEERKAVKEMIEEIETKKLKAFMEAFESINRSLGKVFSFLSPGGKARMLMENETDPFSGGINLVVKPRGKEVQYLEAMSGGEKTLAALSLIFAIQDYRPSPFYYFDEVDAHLDETNARRVGELIKERSKRAQFIVVTLREVLASFSDKLIGVSARGGVSRVFPVKNPLA